MTAMFNLKITDVHGAELNQGDIVKLRTNGNTVFYSEVKYLKEEKAIAPFHTFSFHSVAKVDKLPQGAIRMREQRFRCWLGPNETPEAIDEANDYLKSWRECEARLNRFFHIELDGKNRFGKISLD